MAVDNRTAGARRGIPTARNADHVGITVPDLEQAIAFFVAVLGCELLYRVGPWNDPTGDFMAAHYAVDPRATFSAAMVRCGPTLNVELVRWTAPDQTTRAPRNSDAGAAHLAFYVADIDAAVAYLTARPGVRVLAAPVPSAHGPTDGQRSVYFLAPWGLSLELIYWPGGMPYGRDTTARLFGPEPSWTAR